MADTKRGADLVVEALSAASVERIFTLSGNQIMPLFDACIEPGVELVHVRHEAAAVHMADCWGRLTGEPGGRAGHGRPRHGQRLVRAVRGAYG